MDIVLDTATRLRDAWKYYHDATFFSEDMNFDEEKKFFSLLIKRPLLEDQVLKKNLGFIKIWQIPRIESRMVFHSVNKTEIKLVYDWDTIIKIDFNRKDKFVIFHCAMNTYIKLHVLELNGRMEDIGEKKIDNNSKIISLFGMKIRFGF